MKTIDLVIILGIIVIIAIICISQEQDQEQEFTFTFQDRIDYIEEQYILEAIQRDSLNINTENEE